MEKGLNFRTIKSQIEYFEAYEASLQLFSVPCNEQYISTSFGQSHVTVSYTHLLEGVGTCSFVSIRAIFKMPYPSAYI